MFLYLIHLFDVLIDRLFFGVTDVGYTDFNDIWDKGVDDVRFLVFLFHFVLHFEVLFPN